SWASTSRPSSTTWSPPTTRWPSWSPTPRGSWRTSSSAAPPTDGLEHTMSTPTPAYTLPGPPNLAERMRRPKRTGDIPALHHHPAAPADPEKAAEVDRRLEAWARELDLFPEAWNGDFSGFQFGRAVVLQHPGALDLDRLTAAGKLLLAENIVDS